jgi:hypothetical protein
MAAALLAAGVCAQDVTNFSGMLSIPLGDFAASSGTNAGHATFGLGGNLEHCAEMASEGPLCWVTGASFILNFNGIDGDIHDQGAPSSVSADGGTYLNVPVLTGFRVMSPKATNQGARAYAQCQLGASFINVTDLTVSEGSSFETISIDPSFGFAYSVGAGFIVNEKAHFGVRFYGSPERDVTASISTSDGGSGSGKGHISVNMFQLLIGTAF